MEHLYQQLAHLKGINPHYIDAWGKPTTVASEHQRALLEAMGCSLSSAEAIQAQLDSALKQRIQAVLPPVMVVRHNQPLTLQVSVPRKQQRIIGQLTTEQGHQHPVDLDLTALTPQDSVKISGRIYNYYTLTLPLHLELGYHRLELTDPQAHMTLIVAPERCYTPATMAQGKKIWGPSIQLYSLRSETNWGVGDFSDLTRLLIGLAPWGADFVGLNPIHALYPSNPADASPYSPSSRKGLNMIYIDVMAVPELQSIPQLQAELASPAFQERLAALRALEDVDYPRVIALKLHTLRRIFTEAVWEPQRQQAFAEFIQAGGDTLRQQATFDALHAAFCQTHPDPHPWGWPVWPKGFHSYQDPAVATWQAAHPQDIEFYAYLQFLAQEQLNHAQQQAQHAGMVLGLYRDLAVGVSEGGCDIWADPTLYCLDAAIGAPPDVLGPCGQNWGLPPMQPGRLHAAAYAPFIALLRANMQACGALRIDHVMALLRLWWIPKGESAAKGAYVHYPLEDLLGILALESQRNQCLIIGEDLGTVPDGMSATLQHNGLHSYRIFFFERSATDGGYIAPAHYPPQAMAALTTHDMPTLKGFWHCDDLVLGKSLGLYPDAAVLQQLYDARHDSKQRVLDSLHGHHDLGETVGRDAQWVGMNSALNHALHRHLASSQCALLSIQLEDWLEMDKPVNVPGTSSEYPNWRRKLSQPLEAILANQTLAQLAKDITTARHTSPTS